MSELNTNLTTQVDAAVSSGTIQPETGRLLTKWLTSPHFGEYVAAIASDIGAGNWEKLEVCFWEEIPFGTGGRRGPMADYGSATINERTIAESAQGLATYLKLASGQSSGSAVVSHDSRHRSREFAELTARVFAANGLKVFLFEAIRATPELSFAVRHLNCDIGVMISASHNPPADNGFKAYWSTGGQVVPPHDNGIVAAVYSACEIPVADLETALAEEQIKVIGEDIDRLYLDELLALSLNGQRNIRAIYSPLHGVGETSVYRMFQQAGFDGISIFEPHREPHGDFPNVPGHLPNPENTAVFEPIIEDALRQGVELILASDPDADRIAACVRCSRTGSYLPITGNQTGVLITDYVIRRRSQSRPPIDGAHGNPFTSHLTADHYIIQTLVSTQLSAAIARTNGLQVVDNLLVGFKWIGQAIDTHGPERFVFGFEESLGYLAGDFCRDKDAAIGALYLAELASELAQDGKTLLDRLHEIYAEYGYYNERQRSDYAYGPAGKALISGLMQTLRNEPPDILGGVTLSRVDDYQAHETRELPGNFSVNSLPAPQGNLLIFHGTHDDCRIRFAARPSGTEPKIKFYLFAEPHGPAGNGLPDQQARTEMRLDQFEQSLAEWVRPLLEAD